MSLQFYCVADERYFLGAVAMLNSLRLQGHTEPVFVLDCGLTALQRELLAPQATLVEAPKAAPPWLLKTVAPLAHPADVMVLIDADIIVTKPLGEIAGAARAGSVVAFENDIDRFVPEWGELLDLGPVRHRRYLSSGLVGLPGGLGAEILRLMADRQDRVDFDQTFWRRNVPDYPFLYGDQCVLNAILCSSVVEPERVVGLDRRLIATPPYGGLKVLDETTLRCARADGSEPVALHHYLFTKPWLEPTIPGPYSRLLSRLLRGEDVAVRPPDDEIPRHLRPNLLAAARWRARRLFSRGSAGAWLGNETGD